MLTLSGSRACIEGCCVGVEDLTLPRRPDQDPYDRPIFEVFPDDSAICSCYGDYFCNAGGANAMRITADDYARPDGILL